MHRMCICKEIIVTIKQVARANESVLCQDDISKFFAIDL